jgi:dipeptidyl aminopeptidase/acylaminoacyl peptidase
VIVRSSTPDRPYEIFAAEKNDLRNLTKQNDVWLKQFKLARVDYSHLSLDFAASIVWHCMFEGQSQPPRFNGIT